MYVCRDSQVGAEKQTNPKNENLLKLTVLCTAYPGLENCVLRTSNALRVSVLEKKSIKIESYLIR